MNEYTILQEGGQNDPEAVKQLQTALSERGYAQVGQADGIYGPKTAAAVRQFQQDNQLTANGIAGSDTLSLLYEKAETPDAPPQTEAGAIRESIQQIQTQGQQVSREYQQQLQALYDQIVQKPGFSYDINEDALFSQYADLYQRSGQLAMEDAMGKAAALTGGYGSSYGQSAGQQAYQQQLAQLNEIVPALESRAYDRYKQQTQQELNQYDLLWQQAEAAYRQYAEQLEQKWQELDALEQQEDRQRAQRQAEYDRLLELISAGYQPTDAELEAAGMTRPQANAILQKRNASGSYSGSKQPAAEVSKLNFKDMGYKNLGELTAALSDILTKQGETALRRQLSFWEQLGYIDGAASGLLLDMTLGRSRPGSSGGGVRDVSMRA